MADVRSQVVSARTATLLLNRAIRRRDLEDARRRLPQQPALQQVCHRSGRQAAGEDLEEDDPRKGRVDTQVVDEDEDRRHNPQHGRDKEQEHRQAQGSLALVCGRLGSAHGPTECPLGARHDQDNHGQIAEGREGQPDDQVGAEDLRGVGDGGMGSTYR